MSVDLLDPGPVWVLPDLDEFRLLSGGARDEAFLSLQRNRRHIDAIEAAMLADVTMSLSYLDDAHASPVNWMTAVTNCSKTTATDAVRVATLFTQLPLLAGEVVAGRVGQDQVRLLAKLHANDRCRPLLPDSEELLVGLAKSLTYLQFRQACQRWQAHADPDGTHRDHEASRHNRHVRINRIGAGGVLHAEGDAVAMEEMDQILNAHADAQYHADVDARKAAHGDDANRFPLDRTNRQRRFDAMLAIFNKAAGTPDIANRVPVVTIICTQTELNQEIRELVGGETTETSGMSRLRLCETLNGSPVDPKDLLAAALLGQVRRLVVDDAGQPVHLGNKQRLFTGKLREAVLLTGNRCTHPGCELQIGNVQIDHLLAWVKGGKTNLTNAGVLCPRYNQAQEDKGFTVHRDHTGWHHLRPDGTEIAPRGT